MMTHFSVCTGGGGVDMAAEMAGFTTVAQCEIDPYCNMVLETRWPGLPYWEDIRHVTARKFCKKTGIAPGELTLLSAGIPCQPHSVAGARKGATDERDLKDEAIRLVRELRPKWLLVENVPGIRTSDAGRYLGDFLGRLAALGYGVGWCSFRAADVGAKHNRERVFFVAYRYGDGSLQGTNEINPANGRIGTQPRSTKCDQSIMADSGCNGCATSEKPRSAGQGSEAGATRQDEPGQFAGCGGGARGRDAMGDTECSRRDGKPWRRTDAQFENGYGGTLADTKDEHGDGRIEPRRGCGGYSDGGALEHAHCERLKELHASALAGQPEIECNDGDYEDRQQGQPQPGLGGTFDGLADWLDSVGWIADKGEAKQGIAYPWEPARTATGVENRARRLKMIGNGVVPQQVFIVADEIARIGANR